MTPHDRLRISLAAARYLEALESDDEAALDSLWEQAATDVELLAAFREIHEGILEEVRERAAMDIRTVVEDAVAQHLPSAEIVRPTPGPPTAADAANELFHHPPRNLPAAAHQMNDRLRSAKDELPENLGLPDLIAWAEAKFGPAPAEYWREFRQAALKVRMRANADTEFQLAARRTKPRPEAQP